MVEWWNSVLEIEGARWIIYPSILLALVLVAYYVLQMVRNLAIGGAPSDSDHLGSFRKMKEEGVIDPDEYRKLAELVPLPETESKDKPAPDKKSVETGPAALAEAAREVIKNSAAKNQNSDSKNSETHESGESLES